MVDSLLIFLAENERESNCFGSLPLSLRGYQRVSGEVLVSVNVMGRCFLWQVCLLLIRVHPSDGPPWSREEGTGQICLPVWTSP